MKPFNLEKFLAGEPAITRDGRKVIDFHYFKDVRTDLKLSVLLEGGGNVYWFTDKGRHCSDDKATSHVDLFMEEKEVEIWVNVYESGEGQYNTWSYGSEEEANRRRDDQDTSFLGTHKIIIKK